MGHPRFVVKKDPDFGSDLPRFVVNKAKKSRTYAPQLGTVRAIDHNVLSRAVSI
jgi:hypothetical protein